MGYRGGDAPPTGRDRDAPPAGRGRDAPPTGNWVSLKVGEKMGLDAVKTKFLRHTDAHLWLILVVGLMVLATKCVIVYPVQHVGESDASGYAEMADSLRRGKWLSVEYISFFFIKYPNIPRPEDHWPPLYAFLVAPFYILLGKTAFASKLPSLIISSLFLPAATYLLTKQFSRNRLASVGAAFTVMFYPSLFMWSLYALSDITYSFVVCLAVLFAVKGVERGRYFYLMGFFLGLGYYAKGVTLALIPAFPLFYLIAKGGPKTLFRDRQFVMGMLLAILVMAPWWVRNAVHFGNPLHSTQNYMVEGGSPLTGSKYAVYWDKPNPSFMTSKVPLGTSHVAKKTKGFLDTHLEWVFVVMYPNPGADPPINLKYFLTLTPIRICFKDFPKYPFGIPIGFFGIPAIIGLFCLWRNREIYIVPLVIGALVLFLSILWAPIDRLVLPTVALIAALGWTSYSAFLTKLKDWISDCQRPFCKRFVSSGWFARYANAILPLILTLGLLLVSAYNIHANARLWQHGVQGGKYPYVDSQRKKNRIIGSHWLRDNTPSDAIIMDAEPWDLHFYADRQTVHMVYDTLERILWVMRTYGVTHITHNGQESLRPLYSGEMPGFELVNESGMKIYRVRYDLLPKE